MNKTRLQKVFYPSFSFLLISASFVGLYVVSRIDFLVFHLIAELFSITIAFSMFAIMWNSRRYLTNNYLLVLGIGFVFCAVIDFIHTLSYNGMPFFSGFTTNLPTQLWITARYLQALTFIIAGIFLKRKLNIGVALSIYAIISSLLIFSIFAGFFPVCYIDGVGLTQFKKTSEYIISALLLLGSAILFKNRSNFPRSTYLFLIASLFATIISELMFTLYIGTTSTYSFIGHLFKIIAFFFVSQSLIKEMLEDPFALIFRELKQRELELEDARSHYQTLFMEAPIRIWEEDFSLVKQEIDRLRSEGVQDFQKFFANNQEMIKIFNKLVKVKSTNKKTQIAFPVLHLKKDFSLGDIINKNYLEGMEIEYIAVSKGISNFTYESHTKNPDGNNIFSLTTWAVVPGHELDYSMVIVLVQDITEIKIIERKYRESEEKYRLLFDNAGVGIGYYDSKGNIIALNEKALQNMGGKLVDLINKNAIEVYGSEMGNKIISRINSVLKTGHIEEYEDHVSLPTGDKWFISSYNRILNDQSESSGIQIISQEITERKNLEEQIRKYSQGLGRLVKERTSALEEAQEKLVNQEKLAIMGQLASGVGHELRNPLAVINNALYILNSTLKGQDEKTMSYLRMIGQEVGTADKIISDLLSFARIKSVDRSETSLPQLVDKVLERFYPPENITVDLKLAQDLLPVNVDAGQIEQVLINIITNAYQAMPEGGKLTVTGIQEKNKIGLIIKDSGIGIEKGNLEKIFEPLYTTKPKGIGLGLTVTKLLTEANDGTIGVESKIGKGASFTISFPIN